jgi:hypothetical protein
LGHAFNVVLNFGQGVVKIQVRVGQKSAGVDAQNEALKVIEVEEEFVGQKSLHFLKRESFVVVVVDP